MMLQTLWDVAVFAGFVLGVGAACAPDWPELPLAAFVVGVAHALGLAFVVGFVGFAVGASNAHAAAAVAAAGVAVLVTRRRAAATLLSRGDVRQLIGAWFIFAGWALGLLALVVTYSGGGWAADWIEHWQRTVFFVQRQPLGTRFLDVYSLTARPPLANLVVALLLECGRVTFAQFQVFLTLLGSLIVLPCFVLAARWQRSQRAGWWVLVLLMLSPLVAENLTFSWTKLPTAFFVLVAVLLGLEAVARPDAGRASISRRAEETPAYREATVGCAEDGEAFLAASQARRGAATPADRESSRSGEIAKSPRPRSLTVVAAICLGLAMLTHYSAGPWVIALAIGFVVAQRPRWTGTRLCGELAAVAAVFLLVLGVWVGWAVARFGWHGTFEANSTTAAWHTQTAVQRVTTPLLNLWDTLVPFPLRGEPTDGLITQPSRLGRLRDVAFNLYQVNLAFAFGMAGLWVLLQGLRLRSRARPAGDGAERRFLLAAVPAVVVIGVFVHTIRDHWGLTHICLQPLVLLGLTAAAVVLPSLPAGAKAVWAALAVVDFTLGIALQFGLESWLLAPRVAPGRDPLAFIHQLNGVAGVNAIDKWAMHLRFFADRLNVPAAMIGLWLALWLGWALLRVQNAASPRS